MREFGGKTLPTCEEARKELATARKEWARKFWPGASEEQIPDGTTMGIELRSENKRIAHWERMVQVTCGEEREEREEPSQQGPGSEEEGTGLDIPSISVTETESQPAEPSPPPAQQLTPFGEAVRSFQSQWLVPERVAILSVIGLGLLLGGLLLFAQAAPQTAGVPTSQPIPTTTSRPAAAIPAATTTSQATSARRPRIVAVSASASPRPPSVCTIAFSWTLVDVEPADGIRIHFTGAGAPTRDTQDGATVSTNYKNGVFTHFISAEIGGGLYTAEVIELGPLDRQGHAAKPDANALAQTSC